MKGTEERGGEDGWMDG